VPSSSRYRYIPQGGHGSDVPLLRHYGKYINRVERNVKKDIDRVESNFKKNIIYVKRNVKNDAACFKTDISRVDKGVKRTTRVSNRICDSSSQIGCSEFSPSHCDGCCHTTVERGRSTLSIRLTLTPVALINLPLAARGLRQHPRFMSWNTGFVV
jgi:hypothetical protein